MKKFFKKTEGFTLVELIVVIAILGILAGVGTVGYSGYIKKANLAADQQLLAALNQAFTAACIENGRDSIDVAANGITMGDDMKVEPADIVVTNPVEKAADIQSAFDKYYEDGTFKIITSLLYKDGAFIYSDGGVFAQIFDALGDTISGSVQKLNASTFGQKIGAAGLMERVETVTGLAAGLAEVSPNFVASLSSSLGSLQSSLGMDDEAFGTYFLNMINEKAALMNPADPSAAYDAARYEIIANYAVLDAAKNTVGKTETQILADLKGGITVQDIKDMMNKNDDASTQQDGMANAAMMYAMYTAYANSMPDGAEKNAALSITGDISTFVTTMANQESAQYTGFQSYLDTDQAKTDINGYLGAMDIINQSADGNQDAVRDLLMEGYGSTELAAALQKLMG